MCAAHWQDKQPLWCHRVNKLLILVKTLKRRL